MSARHPVQRNKDLVWQLIDLYDSSSPDMKSLIDAKAAILLKNYPRAGSTQLSIWGAREIILRLMVCCGLSVLE